jgi:2-keto-3-deoxy-L-rhamnonate aldolase RhmA
MTRELEKARALKARLRSGGAAIGAQVELSDPSVVEILGRAGYDWIVVDAEHAPHGSESMQAMLQVGVHGDSVVLSRALRFDPDMIRHYLDLGSPGVLCPFIESGEQAELLVSACRYPPAGIRGFGPRRAGLYGFDAGEYFDVANESIVCIAMIESEKAVADIDAIVAVDGIDAVLVGPMDLSINLGVYRDFEHERYRGAVDTVRAACKRHGKAMGTGAYSLEHARACLDLGDQLILALVDDQALREGAVATLEALR